MYIRLAHLNMISLSLLSLESPPPHPHSLSLPHTLFSLSLSLSTGALGDVMRRRYSWYKKPLTSWDGGEFAPEREPIGDFSELKAVVDGTSEGAGAGLAADSSTGGAGMSPALLTLTGPAAKERAAEDAAFEALRDADPAIQKLFKGLGL